MSQHSLKTPVTGTVSGVQISENVNAIAEALATNNSGAAAPATTYANMWWVDTTEGILKRRNADNTDWISVMSLTLAIAVFGETLLSATTAAAARTTLGVGLSHCVRGLKGNANAASPLTKFDLSNDFAVLSDVNGATYLDTNTGVLTVDLGLAGSTAGGRDQAAAFPANSWVHIYRIIKADGTGRALIASLSAIAPTLPAGYTHWCYATTIPWNGSSNIAVCYPRGGKVFYQNHQGAGSGSSTVEVTISVSPFVPPNALAFNLQALLTGGATAATLFLRLITGIDFSQTSAIANGYGSRSVLMPNIGQSFIYTVNSSSLIAQFSVDHYVVPNGDA